MQPRPVVNTALCVYGPYKLLIGFNLVSDMNTSELVSSHSNVKLSELFARVVAANKLQIHNVLQSSPLQPEYLNLSTAGIYNELPRGLPWTMDSMPNIPVFATVCTAQGLAPCKCDELPSDCACRVLPTQIAKPMVKKGDRTYDGSRVVPRSAPMAELLADVSSTLGLGSKGVEPEHSERVLMFIDPEILKRYSVEGMSIRLDLTRRKSKTRSSNSRVSSCGKWGLMAAEWPLISSSKTAARTSCSERRVTPSTFTASQAPAKKARCSLSTGTAPPSFVRRATASVPCLITRWSRPTLAQLWSMVLSSATHGSQLCTGGIHAA